jgi:hypothetical protein
VPIWIVLVMATIEGGEEEPIFGGVSMIPSVIRMLVDIRLHRTKINWNIVGFLGQVPARRPSVLLSSTPKTKMAPDSIMDLRSALLRCVASVYKSSVGVVLKTQTIGMSTYLFWCINP